MESDPEARESRKRVGENENFPNYLRAVIVTGIKIVVGGLRKPAPGVSDLSSADWMAVPSQSRLRFVSIF